MLATQLAIAKHLATQDGGKDAVERHCRFAPWLYERFLRLEVVVMIIVMVALFIVIVMVFAIVMSSSSRSINVSFAVVWFTKL